MVGCDHRAPACADHPRRPARCRADDDGRPSRNRLSERARISVPAAYGEVLTQTAIVDRFVAAEIAQDADPDGEVLRWAYIGPVDGIQRPFCQHLTGFFKPGDLGALDNRTALPHPLYSGGYRCRHRFVRPRRRSGNARAHRGRPGGREGRQHRRHAKGQGSDHAESPHRPRPLVSGPPAQPLAVGATCSLTVAWPAGSQTYTLARRRDDTITVLSTDRRRLTLAWSDDGAPADLLAGNPMPAHVSRDSLGRFRCASVRLVSLGTGSSVVELADALPQAVNRSADTGIPDRFLHHP